MSPPLYPCENSRGIHDTSDLTRALLIVLCCFFFSLLFPLVSTCGARSQLDGVRILSGTRMEFLQRVPDATSEIFGIGSRAPGALLKDAFEKYEEGNIEADDEIREIGPDLPHAIDQCIEAACHEVK